MPHKRSPYRLQRREYRKPRPKLTATNLRDMRLAADFSNTWVNCTRKECRRAKRCRGAEVACFFAERERIRDSLLGSMYVFPFVDMDQQRELDAEIIDDLVETLEWEER